MSTVGEGFINQKATSRTSPGCVPGVNQRHISTSIFCFVGNKLRKYQERRTGGSDAFSNQTEVPKDRPCFSAQEWLEGNEYGIKPQSKPGHRSTPADWGYGMTICVAAICQGGHAIVTASDMALSTGDFSGDYLTIKAEWIQPNWHAYFSANDISLCFPILREAGARFKERENTIDQISASFREAYRNQLQNRISEEVLGRYNLNLESFRQNGLKQLGRDVFGSLCRQIDRVDFDCQFLVCGFDKNKKPHIFTVSNPGITSEYSKPGFWAIGSGTNSALSTLFFHNFNFLKELQTAIYHVCEAKFMAESAVGVGPATFAFIIHESEATKVIDFNLIADIKNAWTQEGKARIPSQIEETIKSNKKSRGTTRKMKVIFSI